VESVRAGRHLESWRPSVAGAAVCWNVLLLLLLTERNDTMLLVMEFVSNGCLRDYLKVNKKTTNTDELLRFGFEIVEVLSPTYLLTSSSSAAVSHLRGG